MHITLQEGSIIGLFWFDLVVLALAGLRFDDIWEVMSLWPGSPGEFPPRHNGPFSWPRDGGPGSLESNLHNTLAHSLNIVIYSLGTNRQPTIAIALQISAKNNNICIQNYWNKSPFLKWNENALTKRTMQSMTLTLDLKVHPGKWVCWKPTRNGFVFPWKCYGSRFIKIIVVMKSNTFVKSEHIIK